MSPKLLTIIPATSQQGHSILTTIHTHPTLSKEYTLRGITRTVTSPTALSLKNQGIEVVSADLNIPETLSPAIASSHTVILITNTTYASPDFKSLELAHTKSVAKACLEAGVQHIIFSSAVPGKANWEGRPVDVFDSKATAEEYLRGLPMKVSVFWPGMFMQNFEGFMKPTLSQAGEWVVNCVVDGEKKLPMVDAAGDMGAFVVPLLMGEERTYAASGVWSFNEMVEVIRRVSGRKVRYERMDEEVYAGFMPGQMGPKVVEMLRFYDEVGYYGGDEEGKVRETLEVVERKVSSFEEFAERRLREWQ
ncbi:hscarg dehydrogenase [Aspergillus sclerotioniger CBS 115572]|uniref:Hscarg dehydrogenase n=1 Tax=Aspergillus sclerotioniger CBS 115572 TaxID=1450535 RepID=A0A317X0J0_9EURO|nr:hscarg dehydrogenase [Aspergillus sclerotioniger CBS 115572]PWY91795.1 hscarg dehydrogenase [Aspergillus sclerotioniger CBS 115572]